MTVEQANALTARWAATMTDGAVLSGAAVWPLLAYLAGAANEPGRSDLAAATGVGPDDAPALATDLLRHLGDVALGIRLKPGVRLTDWWRDTVPAEAGGVLDQATMDAWIRDRTRGLLPGLGAPIDPETILVLVMALAVRTSWLHPFEDGPMRAAAGPWAGRFLGGLSRSDPDRDSVSVYGTPHGPLTVLSVDGTDDITVDLVLAEPSVEPGSVLRMAMEALSGAFPRERGSSLTTIGPGITVGRHSFNPEPVVWTEVPRFTVSSRHNLLAHGDLFGLTTVTDQTRQQFPGISDYPLAVNAAHQAITASFTSAGFEAAAVTTMELYGAGIPPIQPDSLTVVFDRPFAFLARHRQSGLVLLAGWMSSPDPFDVPDHQRIQLF